MAAKAKTKDPINCHVGSRIKLRRIELGLTQEKLGEAVDIRLQAIQYFENGKLRISASRLFYLGEVLDVPVTYFFDELPPPNTFTPPASN